MLQLHSLVRACCSCTQSCMGVAVRTASLNRAVGCSMQQFNVGSDYVSNCWIEKLHVRSNFLIEQLDVRCNTSILDQVLCYQLLDRAVGCAIQQFNVRSSYMLPTSQSSSRMFDATVPCCIKLYVTNCSIEQLDVRIQHFNVGSCYI